MNQVKEKQLMQKTKEQLEQALAKIQLLLPVLARRMKQTSRIAKSRDLTSTAWNQLSDSRDATKEALGHLSKSKNAFNLMKEI